MQSHCSDFIYCRPIILYSRLASGHPPSDCWHSSTSFRPRQDLCRLSSLPATVLSRSGCDWTGVSLSPLEVIATPGATWCRKAIVIAPRKTDRGAISSMALAHRTANGIVLGGRIFSYQDSLRVFLSIYYCALFFDFDSGT